MLATVNVTPQQSLSSELGPEPGIFKFTRTGNISDTLAVNFSVAGSATRVNDYLMWENQVIFTPGVDTAFVTILPRNDTLAEGNETVNLTINNSPNYQIGTNNTATVTIQDYFRSGRRGISDPNDPLLAQNLNYLEASILNGQLLIKVGIDNPFLDNIEIFLDTDQNSRTGDYRPGYLGGVEYRIDGITGVINDFNLYQLPRAFGQRETLVTSGSASLSEGMYTVSIPLNRIGNPGGVDVIARTHVNNGYFLAGNGDRVPNYGAFDTTTGQVVVRQPSLTQIQTITDATGDKNPGGGFDLTSLELRTIADQFSFNLDFGENFDPTQLSSQGPVGNIVVDSDRRLATGGIYMGDRIPTWGGDVELFYNLDNSLTPQFLLFFDPSGSNVSLDSNISDGRWLVQDGKLTLSGSLSLLDAFMIRGGRGALTEGMQRIYSNGGIIWQSSTFGLFANNDSDQIPNSNQALDTVTRTIKSPYVWDANRTITRNDPLEYSGLADVDFTQVQTQIIDNNLVVKGTLSNWLDTSVGIFYEVLLDTDLNANTGELIQQVGSPAIGADYTLQIAALETTVPYYQATFWKFPNQYSPHEAWLLPQPGQPGNWTVTIPLESMDNLGTQFRFLVSSGQFEGGYTRFDLAPPQPIVVNLNPTVTPTVNLSVTPTSVTENGNANLVYTFSRSGNNNISLNNVSFTVGGTATFNNDYTQTGANTFNGTSGSVNFPAGIDRVTVIVDPRNDNILEPNETVSLRLNASPNYNIGTTNAVVGTIINANSGGTISRTNSRIINIPSSGIANPYPSSVNISGVTGTITKVTATLRGVNHNYPDDLDILLSGPHNRRVLLMSDAGGAGDVQGVNLTFADNAATTLGDSRQIISGSYRPSNYGIGDAFSGISGSFSNNLGVFNGMSPNGNWNLYVVDDATGDLGAITTGWQLAINYVS